MPTKKDLKDGIVEFGVFVWEPEHKYSKDVAVKVYKSKAAAERFAQSRNLVVRSLGKTGEWRLPSDDRPAWQQPTRRF